ncbi:MAG TPA: NAD+ synthase [Candidatus Bipolaricaulis sp.]|nr:NAD+ synthase [Candidatus Bipolaricaulis sp.]HRS14151.1 NAD+ synthase [Candidatus Bipolaricaulis sp.]HRU21776.1 NAD+ synthase [Candidatus Bipolaricaulis sp.]
MRIAVGQLNPTVGDFPGNRERILRQVAQARQQGADVAIFPEHALLGYPPRDLLHRPGFLDAADREFAAIAEASRDIAIVIGHIARAGIRPTTRVDPSAAAFGGDLLLHNAAFLLADGGVIGHQAKHELPSFDVFEEERYFTPGTEVVVLAWQDLRLGLSVCEDFWHEDGVLAAQAGAGVDLLINVSASPYFRGKPLLRHALARRWAERATVPFVYANLVGGQDELVFDGGSFAVRPDGAFLLSAPRFAEGVYLFDTAAPPVAPPRPDGMDCVREALVVGIRDYIEKNGIRGVVVGISGGVDSAVVAALACQALGPERVVGTFFPSPYTATESSQEARSLARALGIRWVEIPIEPIVASFSEALSSHIPVAGLTAENLQARVRGVLWMALANAMGYVVLSGGNKSEIATGYNTLYGDTVGALAPIGDLVKAEVYELAHLINAQAPRPLIPEGTLSRPPSAELRPNQRDDEDLPPYDVLDPIVRALVVENRSWDELTRSFGADIVGDVARRLRASEHKRRQFPLVLKVSPKAFGMGRRFPITHRFAG